MAGKPALRFLLLDFRTGDRCKPRALAEHDRLRDDGAPHSRMAHRCSNSDPGHLRQGPAPSKVSGKECLLLAVQIVRVMSGIPVAEDGDTCQYMRTATAPVIDSRA
jgi:hypothetical protein